MGIPNFTAEQVKRLLDLGLCKQQIEQLRFALIEIKRALLKPAPGHAVKSVLLEVKKHSDALIQSLGRMAVQVDAAHGEAFGRIEESWWALRRADAQRKASEIMDSKSGSADERGEQAVRVLQGDEGPTSMHHLLARLHPLSEAARLGAEKIGSTPRRHRTATPRPIRAIHQALLLGWSRANEQAVRHGGSSAPVLRTQPFPRKFRPSEAGTFRSIVALCYEAAGAGADADPLRAIREFVKQQREFHNKLRRAIDIPQTPHENRTRRKT